jgi:hypothetical protein
VVLIVASPERLKRSRHDQRLRREPDNVSFLSGPHGLCHGQCPALVDRNPCLMCFAGHLFQPDPRTRQTGETLAPIPAHFANRRRIAASPLARVGFPTAQAERHGLRLDLPREQRGR